jgi:uncharacterized protein YxjI
VILGVAGSSPVTHPIGRGPGQFADQGLSRFRSPQRRRSAPLEQARETDGHKLAKIQERVARIKDSMEIEDDDGHRVAMVKKALITPLRDRWTVKIGDGPDLDIQGNVLDHEYTFTDGRTTVATVSKKWFRIADSYGVEIDPDQDPVVVLAATVAVDMMAHEGR